MKHVSRFAAKRGLSLSLAVMSVSLLASCQSDPSVYNMPQATQNPMVVPAGFPKPVIPADNPLTSEKVALGRNLFYEVKLSSDNSVSCSSCHSQAAGFADKGKTVSIGVNHRSGTRNAPSLANLAWDTSFFWDGRASTLEQQAVGPITNPVEMASDSASVISKLSKDGYYLSLFKSAFGDDKITMNRIGQAIASFERTMVSSNSNYDRYMAGDLSAMPPGAVRGMKLFMDTTDNGADCSGCHSGPDFTDNGYYSTGFTQEYYGGDQGRMAVTHQQGDLGKFKTPSLRNVALSAPYAMNGATGSLLEMVKHYNDGGVGTQNQDRRIHKLNLSDGQMNDLVLFMQNLTDNDFTKNKNYAKP